MMPTLVKIAVTLAFAAAAAGALYAVAPIRSQLEKRARLSSGVLFWLAVLVLLSQGVVAAWQS